jgi:hypothetical protein
LKRLEIPYNPGVAPVAQLDRASVYGTEGCWFESSRVYILQGLTATANLKTSQCYTGATSRNNMMHYYRITNIRQFDHRDRGADPLDCADLERIDEATFQMETRGRSPDFGLGPRGLLPKARMDDAESALRQTAASKFSVGAVTLWSYDEESSEGKAWLVESPA